MVHAFCVHTGHAHKHINTQIHFLTQLLLVKFCKGGSVEFIKGEPSVVG